MRTAGRLLFRLRPEEALALVFLIPTTYLTAVAYRYAADAARLTPRYAGAPVRLAIALTLLALLAGARRLWPRSAWVRGVREVLPFLICVLVYTNLHDTIGFVNPHDVHWTLAALDEQIFGTVPAVWAQRFVAPERTELMSLLYMSFLWIAPSTSLILLAQRRWPAFRATTLAVVVCFYIGYALYVIFPAAPPRLVLIYDFDTNLVGYPTLFSNLEARAFALLPTDSRAAFPSLHAAVSLVALVCAWRHVRPWAFVLAPFVLGLWISTIYLRHHFAVDLLAGWALAPLALWAAPRLDAWWADRQRGLGLEGAPGAGSRR